MFLYNGLEIVNTYKYQKVEKKSCEEFQKLDVQSFRRLQTKKKKKKTTEVCAWNHLHEQSLTTVCFKSTFNQILNFS